MQLFWQKDFVSAWQDRVTQNRLPHAVLLAGPIGLGKRCAAVWIARQRLGIEPAGTLPSYPLAVPEHADLRWVSPPEDKQAIGIDQIRELVAAMSLTSFEGEGKVAVIEPANAMTVNAANSLLKTLEEPPGDALLILVADRVGRLPATVFSRCQRIEFAPPAQASSLSWLDQIQPGAAWPDALRVAGGAPLAAIRALEALDTSAEMGRDFNAAGAGSASAIEVAARWARLDPGFVLNWLALQIQLCVVARSAGRDRSEGLAIDDSVLRRMDTRNLLCYLDIINRLRGQPGGSYNVQLTLEALLIDWARGLVECGLEPPADGMELMLASR